MLNCYIDFTISRFENLRVQRQKCYIFVCERWVNSNQMEFVNLIIKYIIKNGMLDKKILRDHPFNAHGNVAVLFDGKVDTAKKIVKQIDELNNRIAVSG